MTQTVVEVHWFPKYPDRFLTAAGSEINLYQVKHRDLIDHSIQTSKLHYRFLLKVRNYNMEFLLFADINLDISKSTTATLIAFETRYQFIRSVAPSFHSTGEILFAAGLPNGKVALCNFATENNVEFSKLILAFMLNSGVLEL